MHAVTRWKTIATIALAFSTGNLFATACQDANKASAQDQGGATDDGTTEDGTTTGSGGDSAEPPPEVTEAELAAVADALAELAESVAGLGSSVSDLSTSLAALTETVATLSDAAAETEVRFEQHRCVLDYLRDADRDGEEAEDNSTLDEDEIVTAMGLCGFE